MVLSVGLLPGASESARRASRNRPEFAERSQREVRGTDRASGVRTFDSPPERRQDPCVRYLGLDLGRATIGLALADDVLRTASALETVRRKSESDDLAALKRVAVDYEVGRAVLGLPLNMDGTEGASARLARAFAPKVETALGVPVELFDERLSTFEAETRLRERGLSAREQRAVIDAEAAAVILQGWLEARAR